MIVAPISYQGGKSRIAKQILDIIKPHDKFCDFCCGSGSISIELINRGHNPCDIIMLDMGPWGAFWEKIGNGSFNLELFKDYIKQTPSDISKIQNYVKELSKQNVKEDFVYIYLILQAASFGGKAIWVDGDKWKNCSFRSFWQPTETSSRRSHVNPMMPMPKTLLERVELICKKMKGIQGICGDIQNIKPENGIVYIDPPYQNTTAYGFNFDVLSYVNSLKAKCYISEGKPLSSKYHLISSGRKKGGISGDRSKINEEYLSEFN